eukprot:2494926-Heterocapsa_arctica.AAC.1
MGSLDIEDQDNEDVLVIAGKNSTNEGHQNPARGKISMTIEGTMDFGTPNSLAPIEALPGVKISESAGSRHKTQDVVRSEEQRLRAGHGGGG